LEYWKTNNTVLPALVASQNTNYFQITFNHRPAESGVTYHVQTSTNFFGWSDIAAYSGSNRVLTPQVEELSRQGSPNEKVTIRDLSDASASAARFWRVSVTRP
jgi:hypothetical protein